jgi:hypothetical protein
MAFLMDVSTAPQHSVAADIPVRAPLLRDCWRVDPTELPSTVRTNSRRKRFPGVMNPFGRWIIRDDFRQSVEGLEPGVHQFIPVTILYGRSGEPIPTEQPYSFLNILQCFDALDEERSEARRAPHVKATQQGGFLHGSKLVPTHGLRTAWKLVMRKEIIAGRHLWRGDWDLHLHVFTSDDLANKLRKAKLSSLEYVHVEEI